MRHLIAALATVVAFPAAAQITLYSREEFDGRSVSFDSGERNLARENFNDRASSAIVRGGRFEVCEDQNFGGRCMVLRPGQYPSLAAMGMGNAISSVRLVARDYQVEERRFAPPPPVAYDYRRREDERLFEADVVDVHAVYGAGEQRCWVERQDVPAGDRNVPGAVAGAVIGGILGHQVGSGRGNDAATVGGAVVGGLIGSQGPIAGAARTAPCRCRVSRDPRSRSIAKASRASAVSRARSGRARGRWAFRGRARVASVHPASSRRGKRPLTPFTLKVATLNRRRESARPREAPHRCRV